MPMKKRAFHSEEMIALLQAESFEQDITRYVVYGSPMRLLLNAWARAAIPGCHCIPADKAITGYYSYVTVPHHLDDQVVEHYDLVYVSQAKGMSQEEDVLVKDWQEGFACGLRKEHEQEETRSMTMLAWHKGYERSTDPHWTPFGQKRQRVFLQGYMAGRKQAERTQA